MKSPIPPATSTSSRTRPAQPPGRRCRQQQLRLRRPQCGARLSQNIGSVSAVIADGVSNESMVRGTRRRPPSSGRQLGRDDAASGRLRRRVCVAVGPDGGDSRADDPAVGYVLTGLGITVGFHRLFTHRSFQTYAPVRYAFAVLGEMAVEGPSSPGSQTIASITSSGTGPATRTARMLTTATVSSRDYRVCGTRIRAGCSTTTRPRTATVTRRISSTTEGYG